jgi:hypothetical protein
MRRSTIHNLIDMGRRAGLKTSELYSALSGHRPMVHDAAGYDRDGNGFRPSYDAAGHQVYQHDGRGRDA